MTRVVSKARALALIGGLWAAIVFVPVVQAEGNPPKTTKAKLGLMDVFELEFVSDPQISPDGESIVYVRNSMDVMKDRRATDLWIVRTDGSRHRPLVSGQANPRSPRWSPDGGRLAFVSGQSGSSQIHVRWMDTGQTAKLTNLVNSPSGLSWSPDGKSLAFSMVVPETPAPFVSLPPKPEGAEWAKPAKVIDTVIYRRDGAGYVEPGFSHLFTLPAEGGTPRQVTRGSFHHRGAPVWSPDGKSLYFSANRKEDQDYEPADTDLFSVSLRNLSLRRLTDRRGPDGSPTVSPDGKSLAYVGYEDTYQGYQVAHLSLLDLESGRSRPVTESLDRTVQSPVFDSGGQGVYFAYTDRGNTKVAWCSLEGKVEVLGSDLGGTSLGRPYGGGSFSVDQKGRFAFTYGRPEHPADLAVSVRGGSVRRLTSLNADLLENRELGAVEEVWFPSSFDRRELQGWLVKPPGFSPDRKYPLILEIHGGPFADYGDRFSAEVQLYAAAGYLVLYMNPRGSSSYGEEFGNLIHHNYPGEDYDDLMSGVDRVLEMGIADEDSLFVTGGSGGGVLTAWIVGKTRRFRAAVVAKPVINWISFSLTADMYNVFAKYWFPGFPWDEPDHYFRRSPLSLVGEVETPTMLLTGELDYRTPIAESEQFYQALKLRRIDTALVRIPGASHGIANRPSQLLSKVAHILQWFENHSEEKPAQGD